MHKNTATAGCYYLDIAVETAAAVAAAAAAAVAASYHFLQEGVAVELPLVEAADIEGWCLLVRPWSRERRLLHEHEKISDIMVPLINLHILLIHKGVWLGPNILIWGATHYFIIYLPKVYNCP